MDQSSLDAVGAGAERLLAERAARRHRRQRGHGASARRAPGVDRRPRARARHERARALRAVRADCCRTSPTGRASCRSARCRRASRRSASTTSTSSAATTHGGPTRSRRSRRRSSGSSSTGGCGRRAPASRASSRTPATRSAVAPRPCRASTSRVAASDSPTRCSPPGRRASTAAPRSPLHALTAPEVEGGQFWGPRVPHARPAHGAASDAGDDRPRHRGAGVGVRRAGVGTTSSEWADERAAPRGRLAVAADASCCSRASSWRSASWSPCIALVTARYGFLFVAVIVIGLGAAMGPGRRRS